jgi:hypothetical protein
VTDGDSLVKDSAVEILARHFPDVYIRPHGKEIVSVIGRSRYTDARLLLGKTGCQAAVDALRQMEPPPEDKKPVTSAATQPTRGRRFGPPRVPFANRGNRSPDALDCALAKLGDTDRSMRLVDEFSRENDPVRKGRWASALGYVGDAACVLALAREMRSDVIYPTPVGEQALRVDIAEALGEAYPSVSVFWVTADLRPKSDWYEKIEKWLEGYLKITWDKPRPPFFYFEPRPIPLPPASAPR